MRDLARSCAPLAELAPRIIDRPNFGLPLLIILTLLLTATLSSQINHPTPLTLDPTTLSNRTHSIMKLSIALGAAVGGAVSCYASAQVPDTAGVIR